MTEQYCPVCCARVKSNARYPNYVCKFCLDNGVGIDGIVVPLKDLNIYEQDKTICKVKGKLFEAKEAHIGGVVVQAI